MDGMFFLAVVGLRWVTPDEALWHLEHLEPAAEPWAEGFAPCADSKRLSLVFAGARG